MQKIRLILLLLISCQLMAQVQNNRLVLTRTIAQLVSEENQQVISVTENGAVELKYPKYHQLYKKQIKITTKSSQNTAENIFKHFDIKWNTAEILSSLKAIKTQNSSDLYVSSDPNPMTLDFYENNKLVWSLSIPNYLELKHYAPKNPQLADLIALIDGMHSLSTHYIVKTLGENAQ